MLKRLGAKPWNALVKPKKEIQIQRKENPVKKEREEAQMLLNIAKRNSSWKVSSGGKKWISRKLSSRVGGPTESNAQAALRNDEDATTTESVTGGFIGNVYLHKVIDTNVSI